MKKRFSSALDRLSEFFSQRKGLLPLLGIVLVIVNFFLQFTGDHWLATSNLFLHVGILVGLLGVMLAWAL